MTLIIYTDGGARGNPGPAAIGVVIGDKKYGEYIGKTTNNVAEYQAVIFALKKARQLIGKTKAKEANLEIRSDSQLMINQLNGKYKIKDEKLKPLFVEIWNLKQDFKSVIFKQIPREENQQSDKLVNVTLDNLL
jgi:ribonuclease HI